MPPADLSGEAEDFAWRLTALSFVQLGSFATCLPGDLPGGVTVAQAGRSTAERACTAGGS